MLLYLVTTRCELPEWGDNDTFSIQNREHNSSLYQWIPLDPDGGLEKCKIYKSLNTNDTEDCTAWVFDDSLHQGTTLNMHVSKQGHQTSHL